MKELLEKGCKENGNENKFKDVEVNLVAYSIYSLIDFKKYETGTYDLKTAHPVRVKKVLF